MDYTTIGFIAYILGLLLSVIFSYVIVYIKTGGTEPFDYKKIVGKLSAAFAPFLLILANPTTTDAFISMLNNLGAEYDYPVLYFIGVMLLASGIGEFGDKINMFYNAKKSE